MVIISGVPIFRIFTVPFLDKNSLLGLISGPVRETGLEDKVLQARSMGFDEVRSYSQLSISQSQSHFQIS